MKFFWIVVFYFGILFFLLFFFSPPPLSIRLFLSALSIICVDILMVFLVLLKSLFTPIFLKNYLKVLHFVFIYFLDQFSSMKFPHINHSSVYVTDVRLQDKLSQVSLFKSFYNNHHNLFRFTIFIFQINFYKFISPDIMTKKYVKFNIIILISNIFNTFKNGLIPFS